MDGSLDEPKLRRLIEVGRGLLSDLDPESVFVRILDAAREVTGARYAALGILDEERRELERFVTRGIDARAEAAIGELPRGRGVLGLLIEDPRPLRLVNFSAHPRSFGLPPGHPTMETFLGVPILIGGQAWGNLYLTEKEGGGGFDAADEESVVTLAEWTAIAVANARLHQGVEQRRDELERAVANLEATIEIARAVGGETDLDRILETIVKHGRALLEARALIVLLEEEDELRIAAVAGDFDGSGERKIPVAGSIPGASLLRREPVRVDDLDPDLMARPVLQGAGMAALAVPLVFRGEALGALLALDPLGLPGRGFSAEDESLLSAFAASAATAVATAQLVAEERLRHSIAAAERERGRWARRLHDESLQNLAGLQVILAQARRAEDGERERLLQGAMATVEETVAEMRRLIADLRPAALDQLGLGAALAGLVERVEQSEGLRVQLDLSLAEEEGRADTRLDPAVEEVVYRLAQEGLNNVVQHAAAEHVSLSIREAGGTIALHLADDGRGFEETSPDAGFGLLGMRERVVLAGGAIEVHSRPGQGTVVSATLPAPHRTADSTVNARTRSDLPRSAQDPS